jgi:hexosaminidase
MKKIFLLLLLVQFAFGQETISIIPKPQKLSVGKGKFQLKKETKIVIEANNNGLSAIAEQLALKIKVTTDLNPTITSVSSNSDAIVFKTNKNLPKEGYTVKITNKLAVIEAANSVGHFYGLQTLLQLFPTEIFSSSFQEKLTLSLPECSIEDFPRFKYRGIMLDVSRHYFPVGFIKKLIDEIAFHKMNTLHWHLTDDQGWRIEIKKYPKLAGLGSIRKESMVGHYRDQKFDGQPYGGYYTQDEVKEIVEYATSKYVTVIPEIEMPGHSLAALAAYPELGCTGGPYKVGTKWGVEDQVLCPSEYTFTFLQNVLTEVMEMFPSQYIHIGGDECPKTTWEKSELCQNIIKKEGLKDEHELQSYFIKRIDAFVTSKGRKIIGWDEILEGGLSPNAAVMSWRGTEGGITAAKLKHEVVMSPNSFMYFDYYQSSPSTEPLAIGGYLPLEKTYSYEPLAPELTTEEAKYIIGVQANLWTEYIGTPEYAEYMLFPRALATAEVAWSSKEKSYTDFKKRVVKHLERLNLLGINYSKAIYDIKFSTSTNALGTPVVELISDDKKNIIRYTLDGTEPNEKSFEYKANVKIPIEDDRTLAAALFSPDGKMLGKATSKSFFISKSTGKSYSLGNVVSEKYTGGSKNALTDGIRGDQNSNDSWIGFAGKDLDFTIDLKQVSSISRLSISFLSAYTSWILPPTEIEIWVSKDGKTFNSVKKMPLGDKANKESFVQQMNIDLGNQTAKYVKVLAKNYGNLPSGHPGEGKPAWLFVDEIIIK